MKVLIVDDNESVTELLKELMSLSGFEADAARDGLEAKDKLRSGKFQSVITTAICLAERVRALPLYQGRNYPGIYTIGITDSLHLEKFGERGRTIASTAGSSMLCSLVKNRLMKAA